MPNDAWNPKQYDKFKQERSQPFYDLMSLLKPVSSPHVIDLGCGTGELTRDLHRHLPQAETMGMDSSPEMLNRAHKIDEAGLRFQIGDIESWSAKESYDLVFSNAALQWCSRHTELFPRIKEALRPGGQIAIQMPMNHEFPTHRLAQEMSYEKNWAGRLQVEGTAPASNILKIEEYSEMLFALGFQQQNVSLKVYGHVMESRDGVIEWVKGTLLTFFKSRLSESDYDEFLIEYKERLFREIPDRRPYFYPFKRLLMWAQL